MDLSYRVEQKQILSQKMIQSASILQMNAVELKEYIENAALENPVIDLEEKKPEESEDRKLKEYQWLNTLSSSNYASYPTSDSEDDTADDDFRFSEKMEETLKDYLRAQLLTVSMTQREEKMTAYFLECLDSRGYFTETPEMVAGCFGADTQEAEALLNLLQGLEPAGVFARNLPECLSLQAKRAGILTPLMEDLIQNHLEQIAENRIPELAKEMHVRVEEAAACCERIRRLNPKPGSGFADRKLMPYITPDVIVVKFRNQFDILLNEYMYPLVQVNGYYRDLLNTPLDAETSGYLKNKISQAEWIRDCMTKRSRTMLLVSQQIVKQQEEFFRDGPAALKPLRLADIAEKIEMHESTVSRAIHGKYLQCSWGIYPMSFFFSRKLNDTGEDGVSSHLAKQSIQELIAGENEAKPYSDQQIADLLCEKGIRISRRTVAKYRTELGIKEKKLRKKFF